MEDYENSTFHHLMTWKLQYQRLVSQLNKEKGPEHQPDQSFDSSSLSEHGDAGSSGGFRSTPSDTSIEMVLGADFQFRHKKKGSSEEQTNLDVSFASSDEIAAPLMKEGGKVYIHLDMDAFYANVLIHRRYPQLKEKPVIVVPAKNTNHGTTEVCSANYVARRYGIRARMFASEARKLCEDLEVLTCDFALFEDTSARMYEQILRYTHTVEAVSADEAYLDVSPWGWVRALELSRRLQNDVSRATQCPCSIGVGPNKLIARLSTSLAKPAGIVITEPPQVTDFMKRWKIQDLPGVGQSTTSKLSERNLITIEHLLAVPKISLQNWFGEKTGNRLFEFARGIDTRPLKTEQDRKSVGTQISWGVRMANQAQVDAFLIDLSSEVCKRLSEISMFCSKVTLRVLKKTATSDLHESSQTVDAQLGGYSAELASCIPKGESAKVFNPGHCTQLSKSSKLGFATGDAKLVGKEILRLYSSFKLAPTDLRGAGIYLDDLETPSKSSKMTTIHSFFPRSAPKSSESEQVKMQPSILHPTGKGLKRTYAAITANSSAESLKPQSPEPQPVRKSKSTIASSTGSPAPKKIHPPSPQLARGMKNQPTITSMFSKAVN